MEFGPLHYLESFRFKCFAIRFLLIFGGFPRMADNINGIS